MMLNAEIISLNVGKPEKIDGLGKKVTTAIKKQATFENVFLSKEQIAGDEQADKQNHGGADKAICVYPFDHYAYWEAELDKKLVAGAFGENLTVKGLVEEDVHIGDVFQWGEAQVQVSQPRIPCHKLASRFEVDSMVRQVTSTGFTGFYLRVLKEGIVSAKTPFQFLKRQSEISIANVNAVFYKKQERAYTNEQIIALPELATSWKRMIEKN